MWGKQDPNEVVKLLREVVDPYRRDTEARARGAESRVGFPTAEHSRHSVWLLSWHLYSV